MALPLHIKLTPVSIHVKENAAYCSYGDMVKVDI
jgi:hypothetical protein